MMVVNERITLPFKLIIVGHKSHGKDFACEYLEEKYGISFAGSSRFACDLFLFEKLKGEFGYLTADECYADRGNHRQRWYEEIRDFNAFDLGRLGRKIFDNNDAYCGIRDDLEFGALKQENPRMLSIWIDASKRKPLEDRTSMKLTEDHTDKTIDNNGTKDELYKNIDTFYFDELLPLLSAV